MSDTNPVTAQRLDDTAIESRLRELNAKVPHDAPTVWVRTGELLQRTFSLSNFVSAMSFVNDVAEQAEVAQHHPDILVRYSKVTLSLSTHDAGGLTDKDFDLATAINSMRCIRTRPIGS